VGDGHTYGRALEHRVTDTKRSHYSTLCCCWDLNVLAKEVHVHVARVGSHCKRLLVGDGHTYGHIGTCAADKA